MDLERVHGSNREADEEDEGESIGHPGIRISPPAVGATTVAATEEKESQTEEHEPCCGDDEERCGRKTDRLHEIQDQSKPRSRTMWKLKIEREGER